MKLTCRVFAAVMLLGILMTGHVFAERAAENTTAANDWLDAFAERIFNAWRDGAPMPQLSVAHPEASLEQAYGVQKRFVARIMASDEIGGFKAAGVASLDEHSPLTGVMPASGIGQAADKIVVRLADDPHQFVENEIGYLFGKAISEPVASVEELQRHVQAVLPIIEVPGGATDASQPATQQDLVAWNVSGKAMILGPLHAPSGIDVDAVEIAMTRDEDIINTARGDMAARGQWNTLLRTVNNVVRQGYVVEQGHVITNGALGKILKAEPGRYRADYGPLGVIEFEAR